MSSSSLVQKGFMALAATCAAVTVISITGLGLNVYLNTGEHRKPRGAKPADESAMPPQEPLESSTQNK